MATSPISTAAATDAAVNLLTKAFDVKLNISDSESPVPAELLQSSGTGANTTLLSLAAQDAVKSKLPALNDAQNAEQAQWLTLSARPSIPVDELNTALSTRTYILNTATPSLADITLYARLKDIVEGWTTENFKSHRHIARWFDLVQHFAPLKVSEYVAIDQTLDVPREVKAKKGAEDKGKADKKEKKEKSDAKKDDAAPAAAKGENAAAGKKEKKEKKEKAAKAPPPPPAKVTPTMVDLRVGHIEKAVKHPDADSLYVSTINCGDPEGPRTVCSGLVKYVPLEDMQNRMVVVVANLKPVNMRGIKSAAMVLCASDEEHGKVEFTVPPEGSKAGDRLYFAGYEGEPEPVLNPKKKIWETVQPGFTTLDDLSVVFKDEEGKVCPLQTADGKVVKAQTLVGATVR
ncbi:hypothetical protein CANCADRAFT_1434 [Tortispora caseinolytica NRRL Y-17796]|uniref:tRNA-binding domain-containing protein n=1 Tax=Tortispora caseinolytica NRRL Y-17796 TaxID=767744 RepID=A0A1E4TM78_9ASCO|nr:hypothetical protein CANCADRAFT_1434 [Tortispora caseinolytica NRRL Y-17796]